MPSRNIIRLDVENTYYHVYLRGIDKRDVFPEDLDKAYYLYLFSRHLLKKQQFNSQGYVYPNLYNDLKLQAYCIMDNHVHMLFYQINKGTISKLMRSVNVSYSAYFNRKYKRRGPVFESRYKSSSIQDESYLLHITRYIHLNPRSWKRYKYSSFKDFYNSIDSSILDNSKILSILGMSKGNYRKYVEDYVSRKQILDEVKHELANM